LETPLFCVIPEDLELGRAVAGNALPQVYQALETVLDGGLIREDLLAELHPYCFVA
jgi:hypothetical protein